MPRVTCPECDHPFTVPSTNRKVECPECQRRFMPGTGGARKTDKAPARKGPPKVLFILGGLAVLFFGVVVLGAAGWYFGIKKPADRKREELAREQQAPPTEVAKDKPVPKTPPTTPVALAPPAKLDGAEIYRRLVPSTVLILTDKGLGSGILICREPNLIATNRHVVEDFDTVDVFFPDQGPDGSVERKWRHYHDNRNRLAVVGEVAERDAGKDLAIVHVARVPDSARPIPLAMASAKPLDKIYCIGNSGQDFDSVFIPSAGDARAILEPGAAFADLRCRILLADLGTYFGDSGGPVVNDQLELVAIVQGGVGAKAQVKRDKKGNAAIGVDVRPGMSLNVDVEEIRGMAGRVYERLEGGPFPIAEPLTEVGDAPAAAAGGKKYTATDYVALLRTGTAHEARVAVRRLAEIGAPAVDPISEMLNDAGVAPKWPRALDALREIGLPAVGAMDLVAGKLESHDPAVKLAAIRCLSALGPTARNHVSAMIRACDAADNRVRTACVDAILALGPFGPADRDRIVTSAPDESAAVRGVRIRLLVGMEIPSAEKDRIIRPYLTDANAVVRSDAIRAFCNPHVFNRGDIYKQAVPMLNDPEVRVRWAALGGLLRLGAPLPEDVDALKPFLANNAVGVQLYVLNRLRPLGEKAAVVVPDLPKSLGNTNDDVKKDALDTALAIDRGLAPLAPEFVKLTTHQRPSIRFAAVTCLRRIGKDDPAVVSAMFARLSDEGEVADPPTALLAAADRVSIQINGKPRPVDAPANARPVGLLTRVLLEEMRPFTAETQVSAIAPHLKADEKRSKAEQAFAAECLADSGPSSMVALDALIAALTDARSTEPAFRIAVCKAIGNGGEKAAAACKPLAAIATDDLVTDQAKSVSDPERQRRQAVRSAALQAIGKMGPGAKDALPALTQLADPKSDEATQNECVKAFGNLGPVAASAVPNLMELMNQGRPAQLILILDAVKKIGPDAYQPIIDFLPVFEKHWREGVGAFKDHLPKARGCIECVVVLGGDKLTPAQRAKLVDALKSIRARAGIRRDGELIGRCGEALSKVELKK